MNGRWVWYAVGALWLVVLVRGTRRDPARAAIAAAFVALLVHTMVYADFLEDPATWALLAVGVALARAPSPQERRIVNHLHGPVLVLSQRCLLSYAV